jgi:hypothetical protein
MAAGFVEMQFHGNGKTVQSASVLDAVVDCTMKAGGVSELTCCSAENFSTEDGEARSPNKYRREPAWVVPLSIVMRG